MKLILSPASPDAVIRLLRAWRFWLLGALLGGLLGAAGYLIAPPQYRARATVNVDFHLEQAWPQNTDREQFYYLERETRKLEEVAMSDATLAMVAEDVPGVEVTELRGGKLKLGQPGNGGWHFYADDRSEATASALAASWAKSFVAQVQQQVLAGASGLEPYITVSPVQTQNLAARRSASMGLFMLAGAIIALSVGSVLFLFVDVPR